MTHSMYDITIIAKEKKEIAEAVSFFVFRFRCNEDDMDAKNI